MNVDPFRAGRRSQKSMSSHQRAVACAVLGFLLAPLSVCAQGGGQIRGCVFDAAGSPVSGARVVASDARTGRGPSSTFTDAQGIFALRDLAAGEYAVAVVKPGLVERSQRTTVVSGRVIEMDFILEIVGAETVADSSDPGPFPRRGSGLHEYGTLALGAGASGGLAPTSHGPGLAPGAVLLAMWRPLDWAGAFHLSADVAASRRLPGPSSWRPLTLSAGLTVLNLFFAQGGPVDLFGSLSVSHVRLRSREESVTSNDPGIELGLRLLWQDRGRWVPWGSLSLRGWRRRGALQTAGGAPVAEVAFQLGMAHVRSIIRVAD
jgi:hypothetical protein